MCTWKIIESYCNPLPKDSPGRIDELLIGRSPHLRQDPDTIHHTEQSPSGSETNGGYDADSLVVDDPSEANTHHGNAAASTEERNDAGRSSPEESTATDAGGLSNDR